jgi:lipoprotein-anchoring transpeptidase ErfK/SrfK
MSAGRWLLALAAGCCVAIALYAGVIALRAHYETPPETVIPLDVRSISGARLYYPATSFPTLTLPDGRTETIRSVLNVKQKMRYGESVWDDENVPQGPIWIRVDLTHQMLSVFRGGHEIGTAVVLYGAADKESPAGIFPILQKAEDYHSRTYDAAMPFMLRLTADGVAIHGSEVRPGAATHGCIGVPTEFARKLFAQVKLGDPVVILKPAA